MSYGLKNTVQDGLEGTGCFAWAGLVVGAQPATIPIPGFRTVAQVEQNAGAFAFGPLTADQMHQIDVIFRHSVMT